jgi:phage virion morphogenesis protein
MTGAVIKVDAQYTEVLDALGRLAGQDGGLVSVGLKALGQAMLKSTRARFDAQRAPDGTAWVALNAEYAKGKRGTKILQGSGMAGGLLGSITAQIYGNTLLIGTNKIYGRAHQFGVTIVPRNYPTLVFRMNGRLFWARKVTIPARPYLGLSAEDRAEIPLVIQDVLDAMIAP